MIHQLIFAAPKPGMTEPEFQDYWVNVHGKKYASKIPQIIRYAVDTRVDVGLHDNVPGWGGIAEIWLNNEEEQLASLQTPEFLDGARADEPRWAAFWLTLGLDTDTEVVIEGPLLRAETPETKLFALLKRREGMKLAEFRNNLRNQGDTHAAAIPNVLRYWQGFARDGMYGLGEAPLDAVLQLSFVDPKAATAAIESDQFRKFIETTSVLGEPRYFRMIAATQNWIIGP